MTTLRKSAALAGAALVAFAGVQPAAAFPKLPGGSASGGSGGFSVSGKPGPFIKQISNRPLDQAQAGAGSLGLSSDAINRGEFQAARLRLPQTEAKVKALLDRIEANWPYAKTAPVKVMILGVDYYSAQALPDGSIMVGFGLLDRAQSDDELAFVLSHELGHIRLGHFAKGVQLNRQRDAASKLGQIYVIASAANDVRNGGLGAVNSAVDSASRRASATNDLLHFVTDVMVAPAWSRAQEDEADALGFDLANLAPYSAESASARVFDTIQADEEKRGAMAEALQSKLKAELGQAVSAGAAQTILTGGASTEGLKQSLLRGAGRVALGVAASSEGGPKHRSPEARKKGVADYSAEAYPSGLPLRDEQTAWLQQIRSTPEYRDAKVAVAAVAQAMKLRADGDYPGAEAQIGQALRTSFRAAPMVINEAARIRDDMGDSARADALFMQAHQSPDQTVDGYQDHVRMLFRTGQYDRANQVIDEGVRRFGNDDKPFLSLQVAVADKQGKPEVRERHLKRCRGLGDPNLKKDCDLAAGSKGEEGPKAPRLNIKSLPVAIPGLPF
ncbi:MAG TPA: M48 family metalloprotease [Caulobacteraceae bacterium]|jgi:Zn-dependent protease with chaperone function